MALIWATVSVCGANEAAASIAPPPRDHFGATPNELGRGGEKERDTESKPKIMSSAHSLEPTFKGDFLFVGQSRQSYRIIRGFYNEDYFMSSLQSRLPVSFLRVVPKYTRTHNTYPSLP